MSKKQKSDQEHPSVGLLRFVQTANDRLLSDIEQFDRRVGSCQAEIEQATQKICTVEAEIEEKLASRESFLEAGEPERADTVTREIKPLREKLEELRSGLADFQQQRSQLADAACRIRARVIRNLELQQRLLEQLKKETARAVGALNRDQSILLLAQIDKLIAEYCQAADIEDSPAPEVPAAESSAGPKEELHCPFCGQYSRLIPIGNDRFRCDRPHCRREWSRAQLDLGREYDRGRVPAGTV